MPTGKVIRTIMLVSNNNNIMPKDYIYNYNNYISSLVCMGYFRWFNLCAQNIK